MAYKLKVTPKLLHRGIPPYHCAKPKTTHFNDKITVLPVYNNVHLLTYVAVDM